MGSSQVHTSLLERVLMVAQRPIRVAILMSGTGTNARTILTERSRYPNFKFVAVATDTASSHAKRIADEFGLACIELDWHSFKSRDEFFHSLRDALDAYKVDFLVYAGFMRIAPQFFLNDIPGLNVHPSDLSIKNTEGKARYTGMPAVRDAVRAGESYLASTAHVVDAEVDQGQALVVSRHMPIQSTLEPDALHAELKRYEHELYPRVLELLSRGALVGRKLPLTWDEAEMV